MKIVSVSQMQQAERESSQFGISLDMLMENAGKAVAEEVQHIVGDLKKQSILIMVGPGNNGGDGLVAARHLNDWGTGRVIVYLCGKRPANDLHLDEIKQRGIPYQDLDNDVSFTRFNDWLSESTIVLDSVFGTGKGRPLSGGFAQVLTRISEAKKLRPQLRIIALDLPSGLNADSGSIDPATPGADSTITLGFPKSGLFNMPGAERAGKITIVDIGIPDQLVDNIPTEMITSRWVKSILPTRSLVSHKGTHGKVLALVGSINYPGAAYLSCTASIRTGAGLTTLAIANCLQPMLSSRMAEVTYLPLPESSPCVVSSEAINVLRKQFPQYNVLLMGCGIGQSRTVIDLVSLIILDPQPRLPHIVLDADGLNILAQLPDWWKYFKDKAILTPHAGEMSRLLNKPVELIQSNRIETTRETARLWNKIVVLKGAYTVIASPAGQVRVSPFANAGLASAGTGDVLAGTIAGLVAQGLSLFDAAAAGVYLHGLAGEMVKSQIGDTGMLASDILPVLPLAIRQLKEV